MSLTLDTSAVRPTAARITSRHNDRLRDALALREARERRRTGRMLIDGRREIERALRAGVRPVEVWRDEERADAQLDDLVARAVQAGASEVEAPSSLLDRLAFGDRNEGVVLVAEAPRAALEDLRLPDEPLVGVVEAVEKPGNLGAILRSADGAGIDALIVADPRTDLWNPNAIRASLGTVFAVPVVQASSGETVAWLRERGVRIVVARVEAAVDHTDLDLHGPLAIVLGSEAHGVSDSWAGGDVVAVRVPMRGVADSLNVSATAAILFYEALRQRGSR